MIADVLGVAGAWLFGFLFPELMLLCGSGKASIPFRLNVACATAFGLMAIAVLF